jgi:type 1 fimbriae regulatory protein FimB
MADEVTIAVSANSVKHKKQRKVEKPLKFLSHEEIEALFRVITSPRDRAMFRIIYHRGLRASEAGQIKISDWSPETERLMVRRRKGSISAPFKLTAIESRAIRAWLKIRGTAAGPMFLSRKHSGISRYQVHELMRAYCQRAKIPAERSHPHCLKHSCGTHVLEKLGDITVVQDWLGHKDIRSTRIYAQVVNSTREKAADKLRDWQ